MTVASALEKLITHDLKSTCRLPSFCPGDSSVPFVKTETKTGTRTGGKKSFLPDLSVLWRQMCVYSQHFFHSLLIFILKYPSAHHQSNGFSQELLQDSKHKYVGRAFTGNVVAPVKTLPNKQIWLCVSFTIHGTCHTVSNADECCTHSSYKI